MSTTPLLGISAIARRLGLSRQRAHVLAQRDDFPAPEHELDTGRVWPADAVEAWVAEHPATTTPPTANGAQPAGRSWRHEPIRRGHLRRRARARARRLVARRARRTGDPPRSSWAQIDTLLDELGAGSGSPRLLAHHRPVHPPRRRV